MLPQKKILIVDDESDIRDVISILLKSNGFAVLEAPNGKLAVECVKNNPELDLVLLDVMMPEMNGIEAVRQIRTFSNVPVLFLTAKTQEPDKEEAYKYGGDDYLAKPFSQNELVFKVRSLIRRYRVYDGDSIQQSGGLPDNLELDTAGRRVLKNGEDAGLTDTEYEMLRFFLSRRGLPSDAKMIYEAVWDEKYLPSAANTVMVHILNIRRKIENDPTQPVVLKTIWGKGYQID